MKPIVSGRYELLEPLGKGGMKQVWRARDRRGGGEVALALLERFDAELFANELTLARRIESPYVAQVLDGGISDEGRAFVVTELCAGPDLRGYQQRRGALPWPEAAALIHQLALGLEAIHAARVLHRDIKPDNAIFTAAGVKVIDFGISLPALDATTDVGTPVPPAGTLVYMAPEVFYDRVDARTDVYALGVTLFELGAGAPPLMAPSGSELIQKILTLEAHDLAAMTDAPPALRDVARAMLAVDRDARPFVPEVVERLAEYAACLPDAPTLGPGTRIEPDRPTLIASPPPQVPAVKTERPPFRHRLSIDLDAPVWPAQVVATGWPEAPLVAAIGGDGTRVVALGSGGGRRWSRSVVRNLEGGLAADLDRDGVTELYLWSRDAVLAFDAAGELRFEAPIAAVPPALPEWEREPPTAVVLELGERRCLGIGGRLVGAGGELLGSLERCYQGDGARLIDAQGDRGAALVGAAGQAFRGDFATPAAPLLTPGSDGFRVAHLENVPGNPTVRLSVYGPGGALTAQATVGAYDFRTAPLEVYGHANHPSTRIFDASCAPLAFSFGGAHTVVVPYLVNAPWWGPVAVGIDSGGDERWRTRLPPRSGGTRWPPMLAAIDGRIELLAPDGGVVDRVDGLTGERREPLAIPGDPIALGDLGGRGRDELVVVVGDRLLIFEGGETEPGRWRWIGPRGDLWRSGSLGADQLPIGPTR